MTSRRDSWDRWKLGWQHAFFGLLLAVQLTRPDVLLAGHSAGELVLRVALLVGLLGWYTFWFGPWRAPAERSAILRYLVGATVVWLALVVADPAFWITGFAVLIPLGMRRPAAAALAVATCAGFWLTFRATGTPLAWPEVAASALTIGTGIAYLGYLAALDREGGKQARLLDELAAAQDELAAAERHAGQLAERQRLAREVHDTLTQGFASIIMLLEAVQEKHNGNPEADRHIGTALRTARDNLTESRRLVWALQPTPLANHALPDAIRQHTQRLADETGIAASTIVTGDPTPLAPETEAGVLRVVQEALTNARRHAQASAITVTLSYLPDALRVDIADDGVGMPASRSGTGLGLHAMHQRAGALGASLTVESDPGQGTTVAFAVPSPAQRPLGTRT